MRVLGCRASCRRGRRDDPAGRHSVWRWCRGRQPRWRARRCLARHCAWMCTAPLGTRRVRGVTSPHRKGRSGRRRQPRLPAQFDAIRPHTPAVGRSLHEKAAFPGVGDDLGGVARQQREVDQALAVRGVPPPAMPRRRSFEGDQFEVGAIGEGDQRVMGRAVAVFAARSDGETKCRVIGNSHGEIVDENHQMVEVLDHGLVPLSMRFSLAPSYANLLATRKRFRQSRVVVVPRRSASKGFTRSNTCIRTGFVGKSYADGEPNECELAYHRSAEKRL